MNYLVQENLETQENKSSFVLQLENYVTFSRFVNMIRYNIFLGEKRNRHEFSFVKLKNMKST